MALGEVVEATKVVIVVDTAAEVVVFDIVVVAGSISEH